MDREIDKQRIEKLTGDLLKSLSIDDRYNATLQVMEMLALVTRIEGDTEVNDYSDRVMNIIKPLTESNLLTDAMLVGKFVDCLDVFSGAVTTMAAWHPELISPEGTLDVDGLMAIVKKEVDAHRRNGTNGFEEKYTH